MKENGCPFGKRPDASLLCRSACFFLFFFWIREPQALSVAKQKGEAEMRCCFCVGSSFLLL